MLVKVIIIFLLAMVLVGMVGKILFPGAVDRAIGRKRTLALCPGCGRPIIGKSGSGKAGCGCGKKG